MDKHCSICPKCGKIILLKGEYVKLANERLSQKSLEYVKEDRKVTE